MFSIKEILENKDMYRAGLEKRGFDLTKLEQVIELGEKRSVAMKETQALEAKKNELSVEDMDGGTFTISNGGTKIK